MTTTEDLCGRIIAHWPFMVQAYIMSPFLSPLCFALQLSTNHLAPTPLGAHRLKRVVINPVCSPRGFVQARWQRRCLWECKHAQHRETLRGSRENKELRGGQGGVGGESCNLQSDGLSKSDFRFGKSGECLCVIHVKRVPSPGTGPAWLDDHLQSSPACPSLPSLTT